VKARSRQLSKWRMIKPSGDGEGHDRFFTHALLS